MNYEWDLNVIYNGFDDPKFKEDFASLEKAVADYAAFAPEGDNYLSEALRKQEKIESLAVRMGSYAGLRSSTNTQDAEALAADAKLEKLLSGCSAADAAFTSYVGKLTDLDERIAADPFLQQYTYLLHKCQEDAKYTLDEKVEEALAKMNLSGGDGWSNLQEYLTSTVTANYRGREINLSAVRNLAYDPDPAVRKDAYDAEIACYDKIKDGVCFSLNNLKLQVNTDCELRGEGTALDQALRKSRMKKSTLDAMIAAIEEYLPVFHTYLKAKAKALGYEGGLKWWDLFAPMGKNNATYTIEEAHDYLIAHFKPFAPDIAALMDRAFKEHWIDFLPKNGKVGGAFCDNLCFLGQSRVLTNFDGSFSDIVTLAHELGHAYHGSQIENHAVLNQDYSMPVAETASTFNETVIMNAAIKEAKDPQVKLGLLESQLQDTTQIICDIMSRFWFEQSVFEKRNDSFMFPDELCSLMVDAQKRGYGDGVDPDTLNPYMWVCKSHYYSADLSYYNFPYAFGGLFAAGLYAQYLREGEAFLPKYRALLHATTVCDVEDVAAMADIDLSDINFWRSSLDIFKDRVDQFLALVS